MRSLKSIRLYFFSIFRITYLSIKNYYLRSDFYNKKLVNFIPDRIFYNPSAYLSSSLTTFGSEFFKITNSPPKLLWKIESNDKQNFENLHSFLWLSKLDRKNSKVTIKKIVESWIDNFPNYDPLTWKLEITAKRIIAWSSNTDITLDNSDKKYKEKFFLSIIKQSNFLLKNFNNLLHDTNKIICCSAIILSGIIFKNNDTNYKTGIKELEKIIKIFFDKNGFPKSRNPEDVFICIKYFILIREWFKEAQIPCPDFLKDIINKLGKCYSILSCSNKQFPLFNGATEINIKDYDIFLKTLQYKFVNKEYEIGELVKIKNKKLNFFIDCGNPPSRNFLKNYQAGCLAIELISNKQKIICNSGYGKYLSPRLSSLSRSTAAHSTLYINNTSSCIFEKNKLINKVYGNSLIQKHKVISKNYIEDKNFFSVSAAHNGYEKKFGYIHKRTIKISKTDGKLFGVDELKKTKNCSNSLFYHIRFHIYPDIKVVKTKAGNTILISLSNGEGWSLQTEANNLGIEKNIFLGNKNRIINNESIYIAGKINDDVISIKWKIEKVS